MIDPREKQLNSFISNINKSNQKPLDYDRYHCGDELNLRLEHVWLVIAAVCVIVFIIFR